MKTKQGQEIFQQELLGYEVIKMEFKRTLTSRASVKKKKVYEFNLTNVDIEKIKNATHDNPYFFRIKGDSCWYEGYINHNSKISVCMLHSFDVFEQINEGELK